MKRTNNFMDKIDSFAGPISSFNVNGKLKYSSSTGVVATVLVTLITITFAVLKA